MDDLKIFCCQNPDCPDHGQRGLDNLRVCFWNGPDKQRRVLACRTCQKRFSERKGTPLFDTRLPEDKAVAVLQHIAEGGRRPEDEPPGRREQGHRGTAGRPRR